AILADKLDFFGSSCQLFTDHGASTPIQRADLLQKPLTRKEASRYLSLTTTYLPLRLNPTTDPTTSTAEENGFTYSDPNYSSTTSAQPSKTTTVAPTPAKPRTQTSTAVKEEEPEEPETIYLNQSTAEMTLDELAAISKTGRCFSEKSLGTDYRVIFYADYTFTGETDYNWETYEGPTWYRAVGKRGDLCWVPYGDIVDGYHQAEQPQEKTSQRGVFIEPATAVTGSVLVAGPAFSTSSTNSKIYLAIEEAINAANEWQKRANQIAENLNRHVWEGHSYQATVLWGLTNKPEGSQEYNTVVEWYAYMRDISVSAALKEVEELQNFRIDKEYEADGIYFQAFTRPSMNPDMGLDFMRSDIDVKKTTKQFNIKKASDLDSKLADSGRNTYIIIHGWSPGKNVDTDSWTTVTANSILATDPGAQILRIDWAPIANTPLPYDAAKWIDSVSQTAADAFEQWGINKDKTIIIGHSLGSLMSKRLSEKLGQVSVIALDPAYWPTGYKTDFGSTKFSSFGSNSGNSACFVADASWSGSEGLMKTCREGYLIDNTGNPRSQLVAETSDYVNFVLDEAVADLNEYLVDEGVAYVMETLGDAGGRTIPAMKLYRMVNGEYKEVAIDTVVGKACRQVNAALKVPYFCEFATKELWNRFVTYHQGVPVTYRTIINYPFYNGILSIRDLATRRHGGKPFPTLKEEGLISLLDKQANGIIYTKRDKPEVIKYLKTVKDSSTYTLYGNTQGNEFECHDDRDCLVYGYWNVDSNGRNRNETGDAILFNEHSKNYRVADFRFHEDPDIIAIEGVYKENISVAEGRPEIKLEFKYPSWAGKIEPRVQTIYLEGYGYDEVFGWLTIAKNPGSYPADETRENPILIE
ncbi:MAG: hypothetical protein OEY44_03250, partial [Candidatus Peregrinibacteria bacterium]|nr:hypothetical protein [Candidatus Peregrinibacteria bacterium]